MYPGGPEPCWFRAGGAWALGVGFDLTSQSSRCFRMAWMTCRSSMQLMIRMVPRHPSKGSGQAFGQVRGSIFPDPVGERLRSSGLAAPSSSGIHSSFYRLPEWRGPRRLQLFSVFPGKHCCTGPSAPPCPGCGNTWPPATLGHRYICSAV